MSTASDFSQISQTWGIALTGGIASGKSTIAASLRQRGYLVIDADHVSRIVVQKGSEGLQDVVREFGAEVLTADGELDRRKMRDLIFSEPRHRLALEGIIHRRLAQASAELLSAAGLFAQPKTWFYEASLIYERNRQADFREVWVAYCPREVQIARVMARDHIDRVQAEAILATQMSPEEKRRLAHRVIETDCPLDQLELRISIALDSLKQAGGRR